MHERSAASASPSCPVTILQLSRHQFVPSAFQRPRQTPSLQRLQHLPAPTPEQSGHWDWEPATGYRLAAPGCAAARLSPLSAALRVCGVCVSVSATATTSMRENLAIEILGVERARAGYCSPSGSGSVSVSGSVGLAIEEGPWASVRLGAAWVLEYECCLAGGWWVVGALLDYSILDREIRWEAGDLRVTHPELVLELGRQLELELERRLGRQRVNVNSTRVRAVPLLGVPI